MGKIRTDGKLRVAAYCRMAADGEGTANCLAAQKAYYNSPTLDEYKLHRAIVEALNSFGAIRQEMVEARQFAL